MAFKILVHRKCKNDGSHFLPLRYFIPLDNWIHNWHCQTIGMMWVTQLDKYFPKYNWNDTPWDGGMVGIPLFQFMYHFLYGIVTWSKTNSWYRCIQGGAPVSLTLQKMVTLLLATVSGLDVFSMLSTAHVVPLTNQHKSCSVLIGQLFQWCAWGVKIYRCSQGESDSTL